MAVRSFSRGYERGAQLGTSCGSPFIICVFHAPPTACASPRLALLCLSWHGCNLAPASFTEPTTFRAGGYAGRASDDCYMIAVIV